MKVLAAINNFWTGGREAFLAAFADGLATEGIELGLLAGSLRATGSEHPRFVWSRQVQHNSTLGWLERDWMPNAEVVWGHHYDLLKPWLLSRERAVPLHTTFHGPIVGDGRPNSLQEALGMTLAIWRAEGCSAVSEEVAASIASAAPGSPPATVVRNAVRWEPGGDPHRAVTKRTNVLFATRAEKLNHSRAAVRFFAAGRRLGIFGRLSMVVAQPPGADSIAGGFSAAARLLGRSWCLQSGPEVLYALGFTRVVSGCSDLKPLFDQTGVVFGMGRVVIEALGSGKPSVLFGYDDVVDVVRGENFARMAVSNFSGRGIEKCGDREILAQLSQPRAEIAEEHRSRFKLEQASRELARIFPDTAATSVRDRELAARMAGAVRDGADEETVFQIACHSLTPDELKTLYRISRG